MTAFMLKNDYQSWGRVEKNPHHVACPSYSDQLIETLNKRPTPKVLATGLRRSYGDSILNSQESIIDMCHLDRIISFDRDNGIIRAEAGASISDILRLVVPAGWFLNTTPGTRFVTLGGAIANDVHGKNHQFAGTLGSSVRRLKLLRSDGSISELTEGNENSLFAATIGGLGLTGIIENVELQLSAIKSAYLDVERIPFDHVRDFFSLAEESKLSHVHRVAWFDCTARNSKLGRGVFQRANWCDDGVLDAHDDKTLLTLPFDVPSFAMNRLSVKILNELLYRMQKSGDKNQRIHYGHFFYPLDAIQRWNRGYGKKGFFQYQCVVPPVDAGHVVEEMIKQIALSGAGSFLTVLKSFGPSQSPGMLSFPIEGTTLALDFPNKGQKTLALLDRLDAIVRAANGRLYPAKDGRIPVEMFNTFFPKLQIFKDHIDPNFNSDFWKRVSS